MANGELYHLAAALSDREKLAAIPVGVKQSTQYFPKRVTMVCWGKTRLWGEEYVRSKYFPLYDVEVDVPELPGYECFQTHRSGVETKKPEP